jgi:hypothetical protein
MSSDDVTIITGEIDRLFLVLEVVVVVVVEVVVVIVEEEEE